ncbi:MAG: P-loop NTPase [Deltaproteobacteria bacterium]|nr:P-loop NTPase [Deltaproteobacteria bacterium]
MDRVEPAKKVSLIAFCSAKGGVGKSTLSVACAHVLASPDAPVVVVDADMTGTSLADGLSLCAPRLVSSAEGILDFNQVPEAHLSAEATRQLQARHRRGLGTSLPFLNHALLATRDESDRPKLRAQALLWREAGQDSSVSYIPSSSTQDDVGVALRWLYTEDEPKRWVCHLAWVLRALVNDVPNLRAVVIDLPPGLFGFTQATLSLLAHLRKGWSLPNGFPPLLDGSVSWDVKPILVLSADRNDLVVGADYFAKVKAQDRLPGLIPAVNALTEAPEVIRKRLGEDAALELGVGEALRTVDRDDLLAMIFKRQRLELTGEARKSVKALLELDNE